MSREDGFRDHGLCERCSAAPCLCANMEALRQRALAAPVTVHILKHGRSYCDMPGVPGSWPSKHLWISFEDDWQSASTCAQCRALAALDPAAGRLTLADAAAGGRNLATRGRHE